MPNTVKKIGKAHRMLPVQGGLVKFTLAFRGKKLDCSMRAAQIRDKHQYVRVLPIGNHTTDFGVFVQGGKRKPIKRQPRRGLAITPHKGGRSFQFSPLGLTKEEATLVDNAFGVLLPGSRSDKLVELSEFLLENKEVYGAWRNQKS